MGTDMRAHLEYNQTGNHWVSLSSWKLIRDYDLYRLLANVRGEGAIYPPRGMPSDVGGNAWRNYFQAVVETEEEVQLSLGRGMDRVTRAWAEEIVARGFSEWREFHGRQYVNNPEYHHASWLTAAEYRRVVEYYRAHVREWRVQDHNDVLARMIEHHGEEEGRKRVAPLWDPPDEAYDFLHPEFRMLLAALEAGEAAGFQTRLIFWFHG